MSHDDDKILEALLFAHEAVCDTHKVAGDDGFAEFLEYDIDGAYGAVYFRGTWFDATLRIDLTPISDPDADE